MQRILGYARVLARARVPQEVNKPFLGKPYLKYGQCLWIWGYFFQLGGLLGSKHSADLGAFGQVFLGAQEGSLHKDVMEGYNKAAEIVVRKIVREPMSFNDYIIDEFTGRVHYKGDPRTYFIENGMNRLPPDAVEELAFQYSVQGVALGAIYPQIVRGMFATTHASVPKVRWDLYHAAELNIPKNQDLGSYEEAETDENEPFMEYCGKYRPDLYAALSK